MLTAVRDVTDAASLFAKAAESVWLVRAARSQSDVDERADVSVGSAVAVTEDTLITNCHVVHGRADVSLRQGNIVLRATVVAADAKGDRCVLHVGTGRLRPVVGMRQYKDVRVGEEVYTIASPRGLERSLGRGIISGLRRVEETLLIQTTAQISPGSSGGGLFDAAGNLLGITTFRLRDSEGLNFAIAVEHYFRP